MAEDTVTPVHDFAAWQHDNLAKYAAEAYARIKELEAAVEQLRADLRYAMAAARGSYGNS